MYLLISKLFLKCSSQHSSTSLKHHEAFGRHGNQINICWSRVYDIPESIGNGGKRFFKTNEGCEPFPTCIILSGGRWNFFVLARRIRERFQEAIVERPQMRTRRNGASSQSAGRKRSNLYIHLLFLLHHILFSSFHLNTYYFTCPNSQW